MIPAPTPGQVKEMIASINKAIRTVERAAQHDKRVTHTTKPYIHFDIALKELRSMESVYEYWLRAMEVEKQGAK